MKTRDLNLLKRFSLTFEKVFGFGCFICTISTSLVSNANCFSRNNAQRRVGSQNWNQKWSQFWEPKSCCCSSSCSSAAPLLLLLLLFLLLLLCSLSAAPPAAPTVALVLHILLLLCWWSRWGPGGPGGGGRRGEFWSEWRTPNRLVPAFQGSHT